MIIGSLSTLAFELVLGRIQMTAPCDQTTAQTKKRGTMSGNLLTVKITGVVPDTRYAYDAL